MSEKTKQNTTRVDVLKSHFWLRYFTELRNNDATPDIQLPAGEYHKLLLIEAQHHYQHH